MTSLGLLHAAVFAWASFTLPWKDWTLFSIATGALAAGYLVVACVAGLGRGPLAKVWRGQSFLSLGWALSVGAWLLHSAWRIASLYDGLGDGVAAAILVAYAVALLFSVPFAFWGIGWTGGLKRTRGAGIAGATIALLLLAWLSVARAQMVERLLLSTAQREALTKSLSALRTEPLTFGPKSLFSREPAKCERAFDANTATVLITFRRSLGTGPNTAVETQCVQGSRHELAAKVQATLDEQYAQGRVKLDIVRSAMPLQPENPIETLMLRPGLDGLCWSKRCFAPWQMVATSAFVTHTPFAPVPDARMGVSFSNLQAVLAGDEGVPLRIETVSLLLDGAQTHKLTRVPNPDASLTAHAVAQSMAQANRYIREALRQDGTFNYMLDPYTGELLMGSLSIPRQAGTTLVLCELGDEASTSTARSVLKALTKYARTLPGDAALLSVDAPTDDTAVSVGSSALSLVAMLRCRESVGKRYDALIARVARALLRVQRPDGGFWHSLDAQGRPGTLRSLYVDGQIMLALVLLEGSGIKGVDQESVKDALSRGYAYFADEYWPAMLGDFFYLEENWHCLAARAALDVHRHEGYERFCIDYARMKARLLLDESAHSDFVGAWGFGNVVPPHNTGTAGFGEAAAAALAVAKRRGDDEDASALRRALKRSLTFLLRNQLGGPSCFACSDSASVEGGFSEHMASPVVRIDYVQHAMAALGHGGRELGYSTQ